MATFLDFAGLQRYDTKIKEYITAHAGSEYDDSELRGSIDDLKFMDSNLVGELNSLKTLVGNTPVADQIAAAITGIVNGAPNSLDTLKEISDWITTHGEAATDLIGTVAAQNEKIAELEGKLNTISRVTEPYIDALFLEPVTLGEDQTVQDAINNLQPNQKLVLTDDVTEELTIDKDVTIEAYGVTFTNKITVSENVNATVFGATFQGEVALAESSVEPLTPVTPGIQ